jgi:restriction endonuclease
MVDGKSRTRNNKTRSIPKEDIWNPQDLLEHVVSIVRQAGFSVTRHKTWRGKSFDLLAERTELGRHRRYGIEVKSSSKAIPTDTVHELLAFAAPGQDDYFDEFWIVANRFSADARASVESYRQFRLFTLDELEHALLLQSTQRRRIGLARTGPGKAILANEKQISITSAALLLLIDERLVSLHGERPNSDEAIVERDDDIAQYERLREEVRGLARAAAEFKKGVAKEQEAVKSSKLLAEGVRNWWKKSHEKIMQSAYDMSMFGTAVGICSMAGSGGKVAVAVSAALVGGKRLGDALKGLKGLWQ